MNKTQKGAWFGLVAGLLCFAVLGHVFVEIFIWKRLPEGFFGLLTYCLLLGGAFIFFRRKQSASEVESDERDDLIKKRAVIASFVSVWILLAGVTVIPRFVVGIKGSIPVWLLAFINLGVLLGAGLVYSVQWRFWFSMAGEAKEKNHE